MGGIHLDREAIYDDDTLSGLLGVSGAVLRRARRSGALQHVRHGTRILYVGEWVMDWLRAGARREVVHAD
jgi:hypothetical protein